MIEPRFETQQASDGYAIHVTVWPAAETLRGRVVVVHGVQSHGGWYHGLGKTLAAAGYEAHFPDRRGSGANRADRGHTPSARRLVADLVERLRQLRAVDPGVPVVVAAISWGGKLAVIAAADHPELVDGVALLCPGLHPRVGVSMRERLRIMRAFLTDRRKTFAIPLSDPALFTANPEGQRFITNDRLSLHAATAGLLAASTFIDRWVRRAPRRVKTPVLLMVAGQDRIVNNVKTLEYFHKLASLDKTLIEYPEAHHTLEFEPDPSRYARDLIAWLNTHASSSASSRSRAAKSTVEPA
jgi:alpha-beta hydrolase superfamily lysophospholipase